MVKEIHDQEVLTINMAERKYPNAKILYLVKDMSDLSEIKGTVLMISEERESFRELIKEYGALVRAHVTSMVIGDYAGGGDFGVLRDIE